MTVQPTQRNLDKLEAQLAEEIEKRCHESNKVSELQRDLDQARAAIVDLKAIIQAMLAGKVAK